MSYQIFRNNLGRVDAVNRTSDGATVPIGDETDALTIELREWEAINGTLDLSDYPSAPMPEPPLNYLGFRNGLFTEAIDLFRLVRGVAGRDLAVSVCYADFMAALQFEELPGFQASISNLIAVMSTGGHEFSEEQLNQLRSLLDANGFKSVVLPGGLNNG